MSNVITPKFRVSYPNIFKPQMNKLSGKEEYSVTALFPKNADLTELKKAVQAVLEEEFGADKAKWPKTMRTPFRDQAERAKEGVLPAGHEEGAIFINLKSKQRPGVVDENVQDILDPSQFYAGCWARASVRPYYYDQAGNKGVAFGLQNIQKIADGDPLSGRAKPENDFAPVTGAAKPASSTSLFD